MNSYYIHLAYEYYEIMLRNEEKTQKKKRLSSMLTNIQRNVKRTIFSLYLLLGTHAKSMLKVLVGQIYI